MTHPLSAIESSPLAWKGLHRVRGLITQFWDYFRIDGNSTLLLDMPARKPEAAGNRHYIREDRRRGFVCASLLGPAATLAEGAQVILAASVLGQVESW